MPGARHRLLIGNNRVVLMFGIQLRAQILDLRRERIDLVLVLLRERLHQRRKVTHLLAQLIDTGPLFTACRCRLTAGATRRARGQRRLDQPEERRAGRQAL